MDGIAWRERDGKRYLRVDYTVTTDPAELRAMIREVEQQVTAVGPGQKVLVIVGDPRSAAMIEVARGAMQSFLQVHNAARTRVSVAGLPRSAVVMLRAFNRIGTRGRLAGFPTEPEAVDWLLAH